MGIEFIKVGAHERMRIQIIGDFGIVVDRQARNPGEIVDVPASEGMELVLRGRALRVAPAPVTPVPAATEASTASDAAVTEVAEPDANEAKPAGNRRKPKPVATGK